jgi:voltage-gated potassium channel
MAMASLRPNVVDFMHATSLGGGDLMIEEMVIPSGCDFAGKTIVTSNLKRDYGITIIGLKKAGQEMTITPDPQTTLEEKDILVLIGKTQGLENLSNLLAK